jgi:hypothetical protein
VRKACAKYGLTPVEFTNENQLNQIIQYVVKLDINTFEGIVILGYDYSCESGNNVCKGQFKSLISDRSPDQSINFLKKLDNNNQLNAPAAI